MVRQKFGIDRSKFIVSFLVLILFFSIIPLMTTAAPGGSPRTNSLEVQNEVDLCAPPTTYNPPATNFGMFGAELVGVGGPSTLETVNSITITHTGAGAASDISQVSIYEDTNVNMIFEPATDPLRGSTTTWTAGQATVTTSPGLTYQKTSHWIWVAYDFNAGATGTHGAEITANTDISATTPVTAFAGTMAAPPPNSTNVDRAALPPVSFKVDNVITYNTTVQTKQFLSGEVVKVQCNVSHNWGQANIDTANITIKDPSNNDVITNQSMTKLGSPQGQNYRVFEYNHALPTPATRGQYWAWTFVEGFGLGGIQIFNLSSNDFFVNNDPPEILGPIPDQNGLEDTPWNLVLTNNKTDLEDSGPALFWNVSVVGSPLESIDIVGDTLTFNLIEEASGSYQVTLILEDSDGAQDTTTFWVHVSAVDDNPVIGPIPHQLKDEDDANWTLDLSLYKSDAEDPDALLTWDVYDVDTSLYTVDLNGDMLEFGLVPDANGDDLIWVNLTDTANMVSDRSFWVNITPINDAPAWDMIENIVITEPDVPDAIDLGLFVTDIDTPSASIDIDLVSNSNPDNINVSIDPNENVDIQLLTENYSGFAVINVSAYDQELYSYQKFSVISILGELIANLISPREDSDVTTVTPKLIWSVQVPSGFESLEVVYDLYLDTNVTNVTTLNVSALVSEGQTEISYTPPQPLFDQTVYYWTVIPRLLDTAGFEVLIGYCEDGAWNFTIDIFAPNDAPGVVLKFPANNSAVNSTTVELVWEAFDSNGDWPLFYDIYLDPDESLVEALHDDAKILPHTSLPETNYTILGLQEDTIYYWTIIPSDGVLSGICEDGVWSFGINAENQAPVVTLQSPMDTSNTGTTPELRWTSVDDDPFDNVTYEIYLSKIQIEVLTFNPTARLKNNYFLKTYKIPSPLDLDATYYWTILPKDKLANGTCESGVWSFTVNTSAINQPPSVTLLSPQDNATVETSTIKLRWIGNDPNGDNITYKLYIGTNLSQVQNQSSSVRIPAELATDFYDKADLLNNTVYYWTVIPFDGSLFGPCLNGTWMFNVIIKEGVDPEPPEDFLFEIDSGLKSGLNTEEITAGLKENFTDNGITLSADAELTKEDVGWKIVDGNKAYDIKEEDGKLNVYEGELPTTKEDDGDDDDDGLGMVMIGVAIVVIIVILIILFLVMAKRKKPEEPKPGVEEERAEVPPSVKVVEGEGEPVPVVQGEAVQAPMVGGEEAPAATAVGLTPDQVGVTGEAVAATPVEPTLPAPEGAAPAAEAAPAAPAEVEGEPAAKIIDAPSVSAAPTVAAAPAVATAPVEGEPAPAEGPVPLEAKPDSCPICSSENLEFGEGNTGKCTVCEHEFSWTE
jgi:hypothetical protein